MRFWTLIVALATGATAFGQIGWPPSNWQPPQPVPEVLGAVPETCITRPNPPTLAVITCNPGTLSMFPPFAWVFIRTHEYGHVNQIRVNPSILFSPYAEIDADCYAAANLASTDPGTLQAMIRWLYYSVGMQGDPAHGTGQQRAMRALQCAQNAVPGFTASAEGARGRVLLASLEPTPWPQEPSPNNQKALTQVQALVDGDSADGTDKLIDQRGKPSLCTALDLLIDAAHVRFWEASTATGVIRPTLQAALNARCTTSPERNEVTCVTDAATVPQIVSCLRTAEWKKNCSGANCSTMTFQHPHEFKDHPVVKLSVDDTKLTITAGVDSHTK